MSVMHVFYWRDGLETAEVSVGMNDDGDVAYGCSVPPGEVDLTVLEARTGSPYRALITIDDACRLRKQVGYVIPRKTAEEIYRRWSGHNDPDGVPCRARRGWLRGITPAL